MFLGLKRSNMNKFLFYQEIEIALGSNNNANVKKGESELIYTVGYYIDYLEM